MACLIMDSVGLIRLVDSSDAFYDLYFRDPYMLGEFDHLTLVTRVGSKVDRTHFGSTRVLTS